MKYIDAEKLIATLERQNTDKKVIEPLIRIIASLQQEQLELDFEKEVRPIWENKKNRPVSFKEFVSIARHFYKLGLNARKEG